MEGVGRGRWGGMQSGRRNSMEAITKKRPFGEVEEALLVQIEQSRAGGLWRKAGQP